MTQSHVISGLLDKRAEILGRIDFHHKQVLLLSASMAHLDATIRLMAPETNLRDQRPKLYRTQNSPFKNGDVPVMIMDVLREATAPISTKEVAEAIVRRHGLSPEGKDYNELTKPIHRALQRMQSRRMVESAGCLPERGSPLLWRLA